MRSFSKFTAWLPLSGKITVGKQIFGLYNSKAPKEYRKKRRTCLALLLSFAFLHAVQVLMGVVALGHTAPVLAVVIFALYTFINCLVVLVHMQLAWRVAHLEKVPRRPKTIPLVYTEAEQHVACAATILGQLIFIGVLNYYR